MTAMTGAFQYSSPERRQYPVSAPELLQSLRPLTSMQYQRKGPGEGDHQVPITVSLPRESPSGKAQHHGYHNRCFPGNRNKAHTWAGTIIRTNPNPNTRSDTGRLTGIGSDKLLEA